MPCPAALGRTRHHSLLSKECALRPSTFFIIPPRPSTFFINLRLRPALRKIEQNWLFVLNYVEIVPMQDGFECYHYSKNVHVQSILNLQDALQIESPVLQDTIDSMD